MGTVTVILVAEAVVTVALVAPKNTILLAAVVLKSVPVNVTASPGLADIGVKEVMTGACEKPTMEQKRKETNTQILKGNRFLGIILVYLFLNVCFTTNAKMRSWFC